MSERLVLFLPQIKIVAAGEDEPPEIGVGRVLPHQADAEVRQGRELFAAPDIQAILIQSTLASLQIEPVAVSL
jgi:hypothetical protein